MVDLKSAIFSARAAKLASKHGALQDLVAQGARDVARRFAPMRPWVRSLFEQIVDLRVAQSDDFVALGRGHLIEARDRMRAVLIVDDASPPQHCARHAFRNLA